jgi:hypothetical protein
MELHDCSIKPIAQSGCFLTSPKVQFERIAGLDAD